VRGIRDWEGKRKGREGSYRGKGGRV